MFTSEKVAAIDVIRISRWRHEDSGKEGPSKQSMGSLFLRKNEFGMKRAVAKKSEAG